MSLAEALLPKASIESPNKLHAGAAKSSLYSTRYVRPGSALQMSVTSVPLNEIAAYGDGADNVLAARGVGVMKKNALVSPSGKTPWLMFSTWRPKRTVDCGVTPFGAKRAIASPPALS